MSSRIVAGLVVLSFGWLSLLGAAETAEEKKAQAALKKLRDRAANKPTDFAKLRKDILAFRLANPATRAVVDAAALLSEIPSPLDKMSAATIPALEKFDWQPKELVAILGEHRGRHGAGVTSVAFSADNSLLASGGGQYVRVWNTTNMRLSGLAGVSYGATSVAFSKDGKFLVSRTI